MLQSSPTPFIASPPAPPRFNRWLRIGLWLLFGLAVVVGVALAMLDPWLRRTLEKQVATTSHGQYQLHLDNLQTHLWARTVVLRGVHLRQAPKASTATQPTLPDLSLDLPELRVTGIGLVAALRRNIVPVDSVVLRGLQLRLGALPTTPRNNLPLYKRLPLGLPGLRVGYVGLQRVKARYKAAPQTQVQFQQASLVAHDLNISAAGAADTTRLAYAAAVTGKVDGLLAQAAAHLLRLRHGTFSLASQVLSLDSVRVMSVQPVSNQRSRTARVHMVLPGMRLSGLRAAALARGQFQATELRLTNLQLLATVPQVAPPPLHELVAPYLPNFHLTRLHLTNARLQVLGLDKAPAVQKVNLTGFDLRLEPDRQGRLFYARAWTLRTGRGRLTLDAPYYHLAFRGIQADTRRGQLELDRVALAPTMSVAALARGKGHQSAHVRVWAPQVQLTGLNLEALLEKGSIVANQLVVHKTRVITESDGRFPVNPNQSVATPDAIGSLPFRVDIRRVRLGDLGLRMIYRSPRSAQPGMMAMQQLAGTLTNVSNDPRRMSAAHPMVGQMTGRIQKTCAAQLTLRANLLDPNGAHTIWGVLGATPLAVLNPMILPTRGLRLRSGEIEQIRFVMQLNRQLAQGTMWATYHNLKLDLLNQKNRRGLLHRVESSLVNGIFLRDNNPRKPGQKIKTGSIKSARELRYSVFSLWRQGLVSGMLNSAGVPAPLAKSISEKE